MEMWKNLAELGDESRSLAASRLVALSDLSAEDLLLFSQAWPKIKVERRRSIVNRLAELAEDNVELNFDAVFRAMLPDPDAAVRLKAIEGLAECDDPSLIQPLVDLLSYDEADRVRAAAVMALGKFALLAELKKLRPHYCQRLESVLLEVIQDNLQPVAVRRRAVEAIAPLSNPSVTEVIRQAYHSREKPLRVSALYAMGRNWDQRWLPILLRELGNPDADIRYAAAGACGELGMEEAISRLSARLRDDDPRVQRAAILALGKIGGSEVRRILREQLSTGDPGLQQAVEEALREAETSEDSFPFA